MLVASSVAVLWVPWFPLAAGAECGWTCYVPLTDGAPATHVLTVTGRGGLSFALLASLLSIGAAAVALGVVVAGRRVRRSGPAALVLLGIAASVATGIAIGRILTQDVVLVSSGPRDTTQIANPVIGLGAALAIIAAVGTLLLGLVLLVRAVRPVGRGDRSASGH